ncbi:hypothetical protein SAMN02745194_02581 [Roseomonas rosea]|uniref:Uncharacterized protein n=1 Tax=Muricoccus roseus TaxID=198092 RepID=A0A1M6JDW8_9PROT|nr:hypothetical protein [Roseomonas rosea]SHJ44830.1 hypothetical protein SAMN02745194_02581 [Roseomonas rosea]
MRAFDGQFSDNKPIRRSVDEKRRLLAELEQTLAGMKPHTSPSLRESIKGRIMELRADIGGATKR